MNALTIAPPRKDTHQQGVLFNMVPNRPIQSTSGAQRTWGGSVGQEVVREIMGWDKVAAGGSYDVVFDAHQDGRYYEIKSVRRSSNAVVHKWRHDKEVAVSKEVEVYYALGLHNRKLKGVSNIEEIWNDLSLNLESIALIPLHRVVAACDGLPLRHIALTKARREKRESGSYGYLRGGYADGYYTPTVRSLLAGLQERDRRSVTVYGLDFTVSVME